MRILIVDDHPVYRDGLTALLGQLFDDARVEQAESLPPALDQLASGAPFDLVLLDLGMADADGRAALPLLRARHPAVAVVVVSAHEEVAMVRECIAAGASGFIPKSARREALAAALRVVVDGGIYLPPLLRDGHAAAASSPAVARLTPREREVLQGLCRGLPSKQIARQMNIAESTVRVHLGTIFRALGVRNRTQAAIAAQRLGLHLSGGDEGHSRR